jgi:hypothetical protein
MLWSMLTFLVKYPTLVQCCLVGLLSSGMSDSRHLRTNGLSLTALPIQRVSQTGGVSLILQASGVARSTELPNTISYPLLPPR